MSTLEPSNPPLLRPRPRRPWILSSQSSGDVTSDTKEQTHEQGEESRDIGTTSRSRSILNLTASTLFGIYSESADTSHRGDDPSSPTTPWGVGAITPRVPSGADLRRPVGAISLSDREGLAELEARLLRSSAAAQAQRSQTAAVQRRRGKTTVRSPQITFTQHALRLTVLFLSGVAYGALAGHLHDRRLFSSIETSSRSPAVWPFFIWGLTGVALGSLLPWIDVQLGSPTNDSSRSSHGPNLSKNGGLASFPAQWNGVIRSIGAFVGIAYAIRKLPWTSTQQLSLTLASVNPCLWYLLDRSLTGFGLSAMTGVLGTALLAAVQPHIATPLLGLLDMQRTVIPNATYAAGSATRGTEYLTPSTGDTFVSIIWTASVLFCSSVCFGSIGRLLTPSRRSV